MIAQRFFHQLCVIKAVQVGCLMALFMWATPASAQQNIELLTLNGPTDVPLGKILADEAFSRSTPRASAGSAMRAYENPFEKGFGTAPAFPPESAVATQAPGGLQLHPPEPFPPQYPNSKPEPIAPRLYEPTVDLPEPRFGPAEPTTPSVAAPNRRLNRFGNQIPSTNPNVGPFVVKPGGQRIPAPPIRALPEKDDSPRYYGSRPQAPRSELFPERRYADPAQRYSGRGYVPYGGRGLGAYGQRRAYDPQERYSNRTSPLYLYRPAVSDQSNLGRVGYAPEHPTCPFDRYPDQDHLRAYFGR